jgi:flagellar protein FliJ
MGFQYKLESLRKYRLFQEERLQRELCDVRSFLETARRDLSEYIARRRQSEEAFGRQLENGSCASETSMYPGYLKTLADQIAAQSIKVQNAETKYEQVQQSLMEAMKKRKMLDRLKEKGEQAFFTSLNSQEQKFISEMAVSRFTLQSLKE